MTQEARVSGVPGSGDSTRAHATRRTEWREHLIEVRLEDLALVDRWFRDLRSIWALRLEALDHLLTGKDDP